MTETMKAAEHPLLLRREFDTTLGPWTVASHPDTEGAYIVEEARYEQMTWGPDGYDISDEEGDRRDLIVERRNAGNTRLIALAPMLFEVLRNVVLFPDTGRESAIALLEYITPNWRTLVTINRERGEA